MADRGCRAVQIGVQIQRGAIGPGVTGEDAGLVQRELRIEGGAGIGEQRIEHPAHGEDGGPRIERCGPGVHGAHFAAGCRLRFDDGYRIAGHRQIDAGRQPADAGAHHYDTPVAHAASSA